MVNVPQNELEIAVIEMIFSDATCTGCIAFRDLLLADIRGDDISEDWLLFSMDPEHHTMDDECYMEQFAAIILSSHGESQ